MTLYAIREAHERISASVRETPCPDSVAFEDLVTCGLRFKLENLQRTGSFKVRGALNRLLQTTPEDRARGVIAASAGNHGQALAYHSRRLGIPATVVMPEATPLIKISNTRSHGAHVVLHGATFTEAFEECVRRAQDDGLVLIHAFDDDAIIAGQGTVGLEVLEQVPDLSAIVVPIGGGGLIAGIAVAIKTLRPDVRVIGVEAEAAASARAAREAGARVSIGSADTIADGIAVKEVGARPFPLIEEHVTDIVTVTEDQIASAVLLMIEREKIVAEGAGAVALAALVSGSVDVSDTDVVVAVITGGNIDVNLISRIIERGLAADGRIARLMVKVRDRPGALALLTEIVAEAGANVLEIHHSRGFADISMGDVEIVMYLETRGQGHIREIMSTLESAGHVVVQAS